MLKLHDLQESFRQGVATEAPSELLRLVVSDGFDAAALLGIYRNNVLTRLTDTLRSVYPVVGQLVGVDFFDYAAREFVPDHLPEGGRLSRYGAAFPAFLRQFAPVAELSYLADVASLEWAICCIRRSAPNTSMPIAALAGLRGDPVTFKLQIKPSARYVASPYAVDKIWIAHQEELPWDGINLDSDGVNLQIEGTQILRITHLEPATWNFRAQLAQGADLGTAIAAASAASSTFELASGLASLFAEELVMDLIPGEETRI